MLYWLPEIKKDEFFSNYRFLITHKYGPKKEAVKYMGEYAYERYITRGIIYELAKAPDSGIDCEQEWIITDYGYKWIRNLGVRRDYKCYFPFNLYYRLKYFFKKS